MSGKELPGRTLRAAAIAFVPEAACLSPGEWAEFERVIDQALADRPPSVRRQIALFLRVLDVIAFLRTRTTLDGLAAERRADLLGVLERSRVKLLRRGVWGLRTVVFMGYYARPGVATEIGYRAHPGGWDARR